MICEWAKFHWQCQQESETVDQFVTVQHTPTEYYSYGSLKEEMTTIIWLWGYMMEIRL